MELNDRTIRHELKRFLFNRKPSPRAIIDELWVNNGNAIADIVCIYKKLHCFEIKGEKDTLERLERQASYYNQAFHRITLVTTMNHVQKAVTIIPDFWGVLAVKKTENAFMFNYIKRAKVNPCYSNYDALMFLWKNELVDLAERCNVNGLKKCFNRRDLVDFINKNSIPSVVQEQVGSLLVSRMNSLLKENNKFKYCQQ